MQNSVPWTTLVYISFGGMLILFEPGNIIAEKLKLNAEKNGFVGMIQGDKQTGMSNDKFPDK